MNASDVAVGAPINVTSFTFLGFHFPEARGTQLAGPGLQRVPTGTRRRRPDGDERDGALVEAAVQDDSDLADLARWINPIVKAITLHTPGGIAFRTPSLLSGSPGPAPSPPAARPPAKPRS
jgi:hypothetical protein